MFKSMAGNHDINRLCTNAIEGRLRSNVAGCRIAACIRIHFNANTLSAVEMFQHRTPTTSEIQHAAVRSDVRCKHELVRQCTKFSHIPLISVVFPYRYIM